MKIQLYIDIPSVNNLNLDLTFNNEEITTKISKTKNQLGHYSWEFDVTPQKENLIKLIATGVTQYINIVDCIIDDINYDIVHIMNCRANQVKGATQIDSDGVIEIPFTTPVCLHWAKIFNDFTYEDYPNWTN